MSGILINSVFQYLDYKFFSDGLPVGIRVYAGQRCLKIQDCAAERFLRSSERLNPGVLPQPGYKFFDFSLKKSSHKPFQAKQFMRTK